MKKKLRFPVMLATGILWVSLAHAQEAANASGGDAKGSAGTVAYSVGQLFYTSNSGVTGSVSPGIQQAYEIVTVGIDEATPNISLSIFPNPTSDNLTLQISEYEGEKLQYKIFDVQGKLLKNSVIRSNQTTIDMTALPSATYFIEVVNNKNKKIQTFKIIKTQ